MEDQNVNGIEAVDDAVETVEVVHTSGGDVLSVEELAVAWEDGVITPDELETLAPPAMDPISVEPPAEDQ